MIQVFLSFCSCWCRSGRRLRLDQPVQNGCDTPRCPYMCRSRPHIIIGLLSALCSYLYARSLPVAQGRLEARGTQTLEVTRCSRSPDARGHPTLEVTRRSRSPDARGHQTLEVTRRSGLLRGLRSPRCSRAPRRSRSLGHVRGHLHI